MLRDIVRRVSLVGLAPADTQNDFHIIRLSYLAPWVGSVTACLAAYHAGVCAVQGDTLDAWLILARTP
jgi:hypothetical protein